ncbi:MAG: MFS transporter [Proteobacteria bacterium]|nr:MFS transporter [Pseudomonadota bacterium]
MKPKPIPLFAIIFGAAILQIANGVLGVIIPLQLGLAKTSASGIGLVVTAYSIGFLIGCLKSPGLIRDIGHIRAFAALAAIFSVSSLLFMTVEWPPAWALLRLAGGFSAAGLYAVIESWVADHAPPAGRGRLLAIYMVCNKAGLMLGQGVLSLGDTMEGGFYLLAGICAAISIVPVSLTRTGGPPTRDVATLSFRELYRIAPIGIVGCLGAGLVNPTMLGLLPVYGLEIGVSARHIPLLIVAAQFGTFLLQWPLGWFSDRVDRRWVIVLATAGSSAVGLVLAMAGNIGLPLLLILFGLWGGFALSMYAVCIVHAGDHVDRNQFVPLVSSLMLVWAIGASAGPPLAALTMELYGAVGLMYFVTTISAMIGGFALWRMNRRGPIAVEDRDAFINIPASSPEAGVLVGNIDRQPAKAKHPDDA